MKGSIYKFLFSIFACTIAVENNAQISFLPPITNEAANYATYFITGNFTNDQVSDVITYNVAGDILSLMQGNGDGQFAQPISIYNGLGAVAYTSGITSADFNLDSYIDLAILDGADSSAVILLGNGLGQFTPVETLYNFPEPKSICNGKFNGDNLPDIAIIDSEPRLSIFINQGNGQFILSQESELEELIGAGDILSVDSNLDGYSDLFVGSISTGSVFICQGNGLFNPINDLSLPSSSFFDSDIADFNNDGIHDLLTSGYTGQGSLNFGDGIGGFGNGDTLYHEQQSFYPLFVSSGDFNGDGYKDFICHAAIDNIDYKLFFYVNDGSGNLNLSMTMPYEGSDVCVIQNLRCADFNSDGLSDFAFVKQCLESESTTLEVYINNTNITNISSVEVDSELKFYPNPVNNFLFIQNLPSYFQYRILNVYGELLLEGNLYSDSSIIDLSRLASGLYIMEFIAGIHSLAVKIVKD